MESGVRPMGTKWTRTQRKRYQDEKITGGLSDIRGIFLTEKMKIKRKYKAYKVARRLLGRT